MFRIVEATANVKPGHEEIFGVSILVIVSILDKAPQRRYALHMGEHPRAAAIYAAVGKEVARRRKSLSPQVTQAQLSELSLGRLSRSAIANIESGRQRVAVHHLYDLAEALNCQPGDFLPPKQEALGSPESLAADIEDPQAREFTRRVLGLDKSKPRSKEKKGNE